MPPSKVSSKRKPLLSSEQIRLLRWYIVAVVCAEVIVISTSAITNTVVTFLRHCLEHGVPQLGAAVVGWRSRRQPIWATHVCGILLLWLVLGFILVSFALDTYVDWMHDVEFDPASVSNLHRAGAWMCLFFMVVVLLLGFGLKIERRFAANKEREQVPARSADLGTATSEPSVHPERHNNGGALSS
ncbi:MAG: hypothetical protein NTW86_10320 [Candidatus Sumerlaeota bacterium]|nr:hypothetical protein [Candidatus Sumerlaeota bacterium]